MRIPFVALTLALFVFSCTAQNKGITRLKADEFEKAIQGEKVQILDVRTAGEYSASHIPGSMQADYSMRGQFLDRISHLDKTKPVYVYCLTAARSSAAAYAMQSLGFTSIIELEGGLVSWKRSGKALEANQPTRQMTLEEYQQSIPQTGTVLVDFGAEWCPPCVKMEPVLEEVMKSAGSQATLLKIDVGVHTNILSALNIQSYPTFIVYKNGKETWRQAGIVARETLEAQLK